MRSFAAILALGCFAALPASAQQLVKERLPTCLACHGENGQSQLEGVPSLGAQQAFYVTVQLLMFREKMRVGRSDERHGQGPDRHRPARIRRDHFAAAGAETGRRPGGRRPHAARPGFGPAEPLQLLPFAELCRPAERSPHRRPARGLSGQGAARLQGQFPPRLRLRPWRTSSRRSPTRRFWTSPITSRGCNSCVEAAHAPHWSCDRLGKRLIIDAIGRCRRTSMNDPGEVL